MTDNQFKQLSQLLGSYLHQDWPAEFASDAAALQAMVDSEPKGRIAAGLMELNLLLATPISETELRDILLRKIGCFFEPKSIGLSDKQWLEKVRGIFSQVKL